MEASLRSLAEELLAEPRQKVNNLPKLLASLAKPSSPDSVVATIRSLQQFSLGAFERGELTNKPPAAAAPASQQQSPDAVFEAWLRRQYAAFTGSLLDLLASGSDARVQAAALGAVLECVRGEEAGAFNNELFGRCVDVVVGRKGVAPEVLALLLSKYAGYADVRYFTLKSVSKIAERHAAAAAAGTSVVSDDEEEEGGEQGRGGAAAGAARVSAHDLARNLHDILAQLSAAPGGEGSGDGELQSWCGATEVGVVAPACDADGSRQRKKRKLEAAAAAEAGGGAAAQQVQRTKWASPKLQKKVYSDAWLSFLRLDLPDDTYKRVLARLHDLVVPSLFNPLLLSDFLTHSLDKGGLIGMLALNGIFILVTQHGLEYPRFYERLYALLEPAAFQAKHRARFFQLADVFLASSMVPAYTAASFAKKFARLALTTSPAGALISIAFIHNILRRHPSCQQILHRPPRQPAAGSEAAVAAEGAQAGAVAQAGTSVSGEAQATVWQGVDVFDGEEVDPTHTRAIESSLWELEALRVHANPMVSSFCSMLDKDLSDRRKTAEVDLGELLASSYASMFSSEAAKRIKGVPTAFYKRPPAKLFDANSAADFVGWRA